MLLLHRCGWELVVPERGRSHRPHVGLSSHNEDQELLEYLAKDLVYLIADVDAPHIDDLPRRTLRHVAGVGERFGHLLRKVSRVVV